MKRIAELIKQKMAECMTNHPICYYLQAEDIPLDERVIRVTPSILYFSMGFKDVCNLYLNYPLEEAKGNKLKAAINDHCREDGTHWKWLMADLRTLGINRSPNIAKTVSYLWGSDVECARKSVYGLITLCHLADHPLLRICIIQCMETMGHHLFKIFSQLGMEFEQKTGKKLYYFGKTHLDHEEGHLMCNPTDKVLEDEAWEEELDDEMFQKATTIVLEVFRLNKARWDEYCTLIEGHNLEKSIFSSKSVANGF